MIAASCRFGWYLVAEPSSAERLLLVAADLERNRALLLDDMLRICQAKGTLGQWEELIDLVEKASKRFGETPRLKAVKAWALEELGDTPRALCLLQEIVDSDVFDSAAFELYSQIAARCGLHDKALQSLLRLYETAEERENKLHLLRLMYVIEMRRDPASDKLVGFWEKYGRINRQEDEVEEACFLQLAFGCRSGFTDKHKELTEERIAKFSERFPESMIFRRVMLPSKANAEEIYRLLSEAIGSSEDLQRTYLDLEEDLESGRRQVPFCLRHRFIHSCPDLLSMWNMFLVTRKNIKKYQLMVGLFESNTERAREVLGKMPLIEDVSLLLLSELNLLDRIFDVFGRVAISKATIGRFQNWAQSHFISPFYEKARAVVDLLVRYMNQIQQPTVAGDSMMEIDIDELENVATLVKSGDYFLFSDDVLLRQMLLQDDSRLRSISTIDFCDMLEYRGVLSEDDLAETLGLLCTWNTNGIWVKHLDMLRVLRFDIGIDESVESICARMETNHMYSGFSEMLWNNELGYDHCVENISGFLALMALEPQIGAKERLRVDTNVLTAAWLTWHRRVRFFSRDDLVGICVRALYEGARIVIRVEQRGDPLGWASRRLWTAFNRTVEYIHGDSMNSTVETQAIRRVAWVVSGLSDCDSLYSFLNSGLTTGTREHDIFRNEYERRSLERNRGA